MDGSFFLSFDSFGILAADYLKLGLHVLNTNYNTAAAAECVSWTKNGSTLPLPSISFIDEPELSFRKNSQGVLSR